MVGISIPQAISPQTADGQIQKEQTWIAPTNAASVDKVQALR
tara:strand:- start:117 stop:242 length:126 start_codon:yes stop_codon:yes gene_type:complete